MKNLIIILVLTTLVVIPIQFNEYYDGGLFKTGLPLAWDSWDMTGSPEGDTWVQNNDYWMIPLNFVLLFIVVSIIWFAFLLLLNTLKAWSAEISRQIHIEKTLRAKRRERKKQFEPTG